MPPFVAERVPRRLTPLAVLNALVTLVAITFTVWTIYYACSLMWMRLRYSNVFLGLGLTLYYLDMVRKRYEVAESAEQATPDPSPVNASGTTSASNRSRVARIRALYGRIDPHIALVSAVLALAATAYVEFNFQRLHQDVHLAGHTQADLVVGVVLIALAIDAFFEDRDPEWQGR